MSQLNNNPQLEDALNGVNDPSDIREVLIRTLAKQGTVLRTGEGGLGMHLSPGHRMQQPMQPEVVSASPARETCVRYVYPSGNNRFEIYGASESELDQKERQIRAMFA